MTRSIWIWYQNWCTMIMTIQIAKQALLKLKPPHVTVSHLVTLFLKSFRHRQHHRHRRRCYRQNKRGEDHQYCLLLVVCRWWQKLANGTQLVPVSQPISFCTRQSFAVLQFVICLQMVFSFDCRWWLWLVIVMVKMTNGCSAWVTILLMSSRHFSRAMFCCTTVHLTKSLLRKSGHSIYKREKMLRNTTYFTDFWWRLQDCQ